MQERNNMIYIFLNIYCEGIDRKCNGIDLNLYINNELSVFECIYVLGGFYFVNYKIKIRI